MRSIIPRSYLALQYSARHLKSYLKLSLQDLFSRRGVIHPINPLHLSLSS